MKNFFKNNAVWLLTFIVALAALGISVQSFFNTKEVTNEYITDKTKEITETQNIEINVPELEKGDGKIDIKMSNGTFVVEKGSDFTLKDVVTVNLDSVATVTDEGEFIKGVIYIPDEGTVAAINDGVMYTVAVIPVSEVMSEEVRTSNLGNFSYGIFYPMVVSEEHGILVSAVYGDEEKTMTATSVVNSIIETVKSFSDKTNIVLEEETINPELVKDKIILSDVVLCIGSEDNEIYFAPHALSLTGAGFDKKLEIREGLVFTYGDYEDNGKVPYMWETSDGRIKIIANGEDIARNIFIETTHESDFEVIIDDDLISEIMPMV